MGYWFVFKAYIRVGTLKEGIPVGGPPGGGRNKRLKSEGKASLPVLKTKGRNIYGEWVI